MIDGHDDRRLKRNRNVNGKLCHGHITFSAKIERVTLRFGQKVKIAKNEALFKILTPKIFPNKFTRIAAKFPWDFYISPDKVPWATNSVPWTNRNNCPWNFTIITAIAHDGVLAGKCPSFPKKLRVAPWYFTSINLGHLLSTPWYTE